jgi:hypothetical protein
MRSRAETRVYCFLGIQTTDVRAIVSWMRFLYRRLNGERPTRRRHFPKVAAVSLDYQERACLLAVC